MQRVLCLIAWSAVLAATSGCGEQPGPIARVEEVVPVSGTLTYQGRPLESFQVTFVPTDGQRRPASGITDAQGRFALGTNEVGDGAPPGSHRIAVVWMSPAALNPTGDEQIIDDPAQMPKPPVELPTKYASPETSELTQEVPATGIEDLKLELQ